MSPVPSAEWPLLTTCLYRPWSRKEVDRLSLSTFPCVQTGLGWVETRKCWFFFLTNVEASTRVLFSRVLLDLAWMGRGFSHVGAALLTDACCSQPGSVAGRLLAGELGARGLPDAGTDENTWPLVVTGAVSQLSCHGGGPTGKMPELIPQPGPQLRGGCVERWLGAGTGQSAEFASQLPGRVTSSNLQPL